MKTRKHYLKNRRITKRVTLEKLGFDDLYGKLTDISRIFTDLIKEYSTDEKYSMYGDFIVDPVIEQERYTDDHTMSLEVIGVIFETEEEYCKRQNISKLI